MNRVLLMGLLVMNCLNAKIIIMRHGEGTHNIELFHSSNPDHPNYRPAYLTEKGKEQVQETAEQLRSLGFSKDTISVAFVSPLPRTQQTAQILVEQGVLAADAIVFDKRLIEVQMGDREGRYCSEFPESHWDHSSALLYHGETIEQVLERMKDIFNEVKSMHSDTKHILLITHGTPALKLLEWYAQESRILPTAGFYIFD